MSHQGWFSLPLFLERAPFEKVLVIVAHPDDAEIWAGGLLTMAPHASILVVTCGEGGGVRLQRMDEQRAAGEILGVDSLKFLRFRDGFVFDNEALRQHLLVAVGREQPQLVVTHAPWSYHADHRAVADAVTAIVTLTDKPWFMRTESELGDNRFENPVLWYFHSEKPMPMPLEERVLDISEVMWQKKQAINAHVSQRADYADDYPLKQASDWAKGTAARYAERFYLSPYGRHDNLR